MSEPPPLPHLALSFFLSRSGSAEILSDSVCVFGQWKTGQKQHCQHTVSTQRAGVRHRNGPLRVQAC